VKISFLNSTNDGMEEAMHVGRGRVDVDGWMDA